MEDFPIQWLLRRNKKELKDAVYHQFAEYWKGV